MRLKTIEFINIFPVSGSHSDGISVLAHELCESDSRVSPSPPGAPAKLSLDQVTTNHVCRQPAIYAKFCCEIVPPRSNSESETGSLSLSSTDTWRCCTFLLYLFLCFILSHPSIQFPKRYIEKKTQPERANTRLSWFPATPINSTTQKPEYTTSQKGM